MSDDFPVGTKELLARRVGAVCSNPECRQPTSGPQVDKAGAVNVGVAAHVSAASAGGPRYDPTLTPEQRRDSSNGIWLCQTCAKLIDSDIRRYSNTVLEAWKRAAEHAAAQALARGRPGSDGQQAAFAKIERLMPALLKEMREDLDREPTTREFIPMQKGWAYWGTNSQFQYDLDLHDDLRGKLTILENLGLIRRTKLSSNIDHYLLSESFVDYLTS